MKSKNHMLLKWRPRDPLEWALGLLVISLIWLMWDYHRSLLIIGSLYLFGTICFVLVVASYFRGQKIQRDRKDQGRH